MSLPPLPPAHYIDTYTQLIELVDKLKHESIIAFDTESNSMYAYQARVCLIQLSTRENDYIVDPLTIDNMLPLKEIFDNARIEKIFHAAEYDLISLRRDYGFEVTNLFDTMYAARLCGAKDFGLADLLNVHFGLKLDKSHQLDDWAQRPLDEESLIYAQMDTHYLPALRDKLFKTLQSNEQLEEVAEIFEDVTRIQAHDRTFDTEGYWKIGKPRGLNRRQMAILRELYLIREEIAKAEDVPPYKLITNKLLARMAVKRPLNFTELHQFRHIDHRIIRLYGDELLDAVERGKDSRVPSPPQLEHPNPIIAERYTLLHAWRKEHAISRGIESNLVISKQTMWDIAHRVPHTLDALAEIDGIGNWRIQHYGQKILNVVETFRK